MSREYFKTLEEILIEQISNDSISEIEDFLGYPISKDVLDNIEEKIKEVLCQMPEKELLAYQKKYKITVRTFRVHIDWDTDGDDPTELGLPLTKIITSYYPDQFIDQQSFWDDVVDTLSDNYGFCILGIDTVEE